MQKRKPTSQDIYAIDYYVATKYKSVKCPAME
jgi:hypothetical protein